MPVGRRRRSSGRGGAVGGAHGLVAGATAVLLALGPSPASANPAPDPELERDAAHQTDAQTLTVLHDRAGRAYLYVTQHDDGLLILDTADPHQPRPVAHLGGAAFDGRYVNNLHQQGHRLYVATGNFIGSPGQAPGLAVVDVADPTQPRVVGHWVHPTGARGAHVVEVDGDLAYVGGSHEGLLILDVADPARIRLVSQLVPDPDFPREPTGPFQLPAARGLTVVDDTLVAVAYDAGGLRLIDVSDPSGPVEVGRHANPGIDPAQQPQAYNNVVTRDGLAYVAVDYCGIEVVDVTDPTAPRQLAWWNPWHCQLSAMMWFLSPGHTNELVLLPDQGRLFASAGDTELVVLDVSDPANPVQVGQWGGPFNGHTAWGLDVTATHAYLGHISTLGVPFLGLWRGVIALRHH